MMSRGRNIEMGRAVADLIRADAVRSRFAEAAEEMKAILVADPSKLAASIVLPRELFGLYLPSELQSCRLSVMRGGAACHVERHPNATQYLLSVEGIGTIRVKSDDGWVVCRLSSGPSVPLLERWHMVPTNTWHQPTPGENDWTVVAFHTAPAGELKDEYGDHE
jgi:hypothetical protein